jgi:hypothetical protein
LVSDAIEQLELINAIRDVWLIEDGHSVTDPYVAQQEALFSYYGMLHNKETAVELIHAWTEDSGDGVYNLYLLVHRFCRTTPGEATKQLVVAQRSTPEQRDLAVDRFVKTRVASVHFHTALNREEISSYASCTGFLEDGRKYMVCRAMLYTDDFKADVTRNGSFGGCYLLPIEIRPEERAGYASVRCITLNPPNVSTNEVLLRIIPDIVKCTITGV